MVGLITGASKNHTYKNRTVILWDKCNINSVRLGLAVFGRCALLVQFGVDKGRNQTDLCLFHL